MTDLMMHGVLNMPLPNDPSDIDLVTWFQFRDRARQAAARIVELEGERDRQYEQNAEFIVKVAELDAAMATARDDALREAIDEVHQECWTVGPITETLMAEQATTELAIRAIQSLIDKETTP